MAIVKSGTGNVRTDTGQVAVQQKKSQGNKHNMEKSRLREQT
jgi:hypothetical protein